MTVLEMLSIPSLKGLRVIAGHQGLTSQITTVSVMDAPDIYNWMKGGEFLITSAYPIKNNADYLVDLIERLSQAKVAAFGVKFSRFLGGEPQFAIDAANRLGLPLISIPEQFAFTDIINPILYRIVDQQAFTLYQKDKLHKSFIQVVLNSSDTQSILNTLTTFIGVPSVFANTFFEDVTSDSGGKDFAQELFPQLFSGSPSEKTSSYCSFPVCNDKVVYGRLYIKHPCNDTAISDIQQTAIDYAGILLALNTQMRISNSRVEERYRNEFLSDLFLNNIKSEREIHKRAKLYGWSFPNGGMVVIVDINNVKRLYAQGFDNTASETIEKVVATISDISLKEFRTLFGNVQYYKQSDFITYLISCQSYDQKSMENRLWQVFRQIQKHVKEKTHYTVSVGVGTYKENIADISESYQEARYVVRTGNETGQKDTLLFFNHMTTFRLLSAISDYSIKKEFTEKYLTPVLLYDVDHGSDLFTTLKAAINCGWNLKNAASSLYIHYNSMKYRIAKIGELLDLDMHEHENQLNIELAVKMYTIDK